ncbi:sel1 repeat family protein (plasmid) [Methylobacterium sp. NMS14P]|uniref:tetratricopeptide repeat protein n=1 Tax=Methylobacterium sp. NMS14P TaxID=2894310 RepID=UPI00235917F5|nr:tetratricopeptide repeat protein [Methylobacterium sp. NMS14P]WCS28636.1 sel1 repeat family protein [Methylobacterium sp. NMS14P]
MPTLSSSSENRLRSTVSIGLLVVVGSLSCGVSSAHDGDPGVGAVQSCDRLASAPWDPDAPDAQRTVNFRDLRAGAAVAACRAAVAEAPRLRRLHFQLGRAYDRQGANNDAFEAYRRAAELGSGAAKVNIGILYQQGRRFEKSDAKARAWFRDAAATGIPEGMYCYAVALDNGIGGSPDAAAARAWYVKAAERGTAKARDALVRLELDGTGTGVRCD